MQGANPVQGRFFDLLAKNGNKIFEVMIIRGHSCKMFGKLEGGFRVSGVTVNADQGRRGCDSVQHRRG
jgi:hypothetical protein